MVDRIAGCLLGGALGDAIGAQFEGREPSQTCELESPLRITDDTQLTIATCESIIDCGSVKPESVANHCLRWFRERRLTGMGSSTLKALTELDAGGHWALVGATGERAAGAGAAMRAAPLAFVLDPDVDEERQTIRDVCRITHRNEEAYVGGLAIVRALRHVLCGGSLDDRIVATLVDALPDSRVRDRLAEVSHGMPTIDQYAARYGTSGFVADAVPLAVLAAIHSSEISDTIRQLVRCGGDTDTIAAMYGQIVGAACGTSVLPRELVDRIDASPLIRETATRFSEFARV